MQFTMDSFEKYSISLFISLTFFFTSFSPTYNTSLVYFAEVVVVIASFFLGICVEFVLLSVKKNYVLLEFAFDLSSLDV